MRNVAIIDFEASCLPEDGDSFPIEVALAKAGGQSRSWLIKPPRQWRYWTWSREAEALHGISREMLEREGVPAAQVLRELAAAAKDCDVYTDSDLDAYWLETLYTACGASAPFPLRYLGELFQSLAVPRADIIQAEKLARTNLPRQHIARQDARRLALTVDLLTAA